MSKKDYYELLGVKKDVTEEKLKKAYKKLAMKHHPDRNVGDVKAEETFKEINKAYEVLSDPEKRAMYDQYGHDGLEQHGRGGHHGFHDHFEHFAHQMHEAQNRGSDIQHVLNITLEEAVQGITKTIEVSIDAICVVCHGTGAEPGAIPTKCPTCQGRGAMILNHMGFQIQQVCPHCGGKGHVITSHCKNCHGNGVNRKNIKTEVEIPAGVDSGAAIRYAGKGNCSRTGASSGNLFVVIQIVPHKIFRREGNDIHVESKISFVTAALGGEIEIPTLNGHAKIKIPEETQTGKQLRLRDKGIKGINSLNHGDLYCHVIVETPINLTSRQKEILQEFDK